MDLMRLRQRGQMADGPGDYVAIAVLISVAWAGRAQNARNIARHRRFFGEHGNGPGFRSRHDDYSLACAAGC